MKYLYTFSVFLLLVGIILLAYNNNNMTPNDKTIKTKSNIYDYRVSKTFKNMFSEPEIWLGYKSYDPSELTDKIYIKS